MAAEPVPREGGVVHEVRLLVLILLQVKEQPRRPLEAAVLPAVAADDAAPGAVYTVRALTARALSAHYTVYIMDEKKCKVPDEYKVPDE